MPEISSLSFLTPGNYADDDPYSGLEATLRLFAYGEAEGYDGAWIRQRHLEHSVSSAAVFLAAAGQRTRRIEIGTGVIPIGYENPFRLAEDLTTVDVLSQGRLQAGFSTGMPHADLLAHLVHEGDWQSYELSYERIGRVLDHLRSEYLGEPGTTIQSPGAVQRPRLQPTSPGLLDRSWLGGTSPRSVRWAAEHGLNLLTGNIVQGEGPDGHADQQREQIALYRSLLPADRPGRIAVGRVIVPWDGADAATRERYRAYEASRHERTLTVHGERRVRFAEDLVGPASEIVDRLRSDVALSDVTELRLELPYEFGEEDYHQILHDARTLVAPALGWRPAAPAPEPVAG